MNIFSDLALGFHEIFAPATLLYCFIGAFLGTLIGVLPGIGPLPTIALLLPTTYYLSPLNSLVMLAGVYYGSQYGGSTTAILVRIPGESSSVVTCLDGNEMAKQGRAGSALAIAALGSFFAGCVGTLAIAILAEPLSSVALKFTSPEYFSLVVLGLICSVVLSTGSLLTAIPMVILGILFGMVGIDVNSGTIRYTFGISKLMDGIDFVILAMGLFGIAEIVRNIQSPETRARYSAGIRDLLPNRAEAKAAWPAVLRGSALGGFLGILPGAGVSVASFASYALEKKVARDPSRFGKGAVEGLAAPESANNAAAQTSFIPTLTLGVPGSATMAVMLAAMMIQGIAPGPQIMTEHPDLFWGMIASMWLGNLMLVILNLPLIGIWVQLLALPYRMLFPIILIFACVGVFSLNHDPMDLVVLAAMAWIGYIFYRLDLEPAPLLLGFILGPIMEENLRRSLLLSGGDASIFFVKPISCLFLGCSALLLLLPLILPSLRRMVRTSAGETTG